MADETIRKDIPQDEDTGAQEAELSAPQEEGESEETKESAPEIPSVLPLLPVRDIVIFPYMTLPLFVGREASIAAVDEALGRDRYIFLATQKDPSLEEPKPEDLYRTGTVAMIMRMLKLPDGRLKILIQGVVKGRIVEFIEAKPSVRVQIERVVEGATREGSLEVEALMRACREKIEKILSLKNMPVEILMVTENINKPGVLADLVASNLRLKLEEAQGVLEEGDPVARLTMVNNLLTRELQLAEMQAKIQNQAKEEMSKSQREYFLREQMKAIKTELGDIDSKSEEIEELREKIKKVGMSEEVEKEADKQLRRLEGMHPDSAESSVVRTYLDWMVELPWKKETKDNIHIAKAKKILDEDHHDLEKVKERILEYLAVRKLRKDLAGEIDRPGDGTQVHPDLPGRNPRRGRDPRPQTNVCRGAPRTHHPGDEAGGYEEPDLHARRDRQGGGRFPGGSLRGPPGGSRPRAELLLQRQLPERPVRPFEGDVHRYTDVDKLAIAKKFLFPRQKEENGITEKQVKVTDRGILAIIHQYTREAGLRNLEREISTICRKVARRIAEGEKGPFAVTHRNLSKFLGVPKYLPETEGERDEVGLGTGLAWTPTGGDILFVEVSLVKGKGTVTITGSLGDVMKESAQAAITYTRSRAARLGLPKDFHSQYDIHIHVPAGAIPKDGPSAGITIATALISSLTGIPVRRDVAMTGEITLRGRVLPIGGLKEKALAALRAGITEVIVPGQNRKDLEDIPRSEARRFTFTLVDSARKAGKAARPGAAVPRVRKNQ
jgi:ATP-dependent Lon protease